MFTHNRPSRINRSVVPAEIDMLSSSKRLLVITKLFRSQIRCGWGGSMSYRDVYVEDRGYDYLKWIREHSLQSAKIKHPSSTHVVSNYASYVHKHGSYNFSNVDDYVLNVAAFHELPPRNTPDSLNCKIETDSITGHTVMLWPDSIILSNLVVEDIPVIGKSLLRDVQLDQTNLASLLNPCAKISSISELTIVMSVSSVFTFSQALRTKEWFETAFQNHNYSQQVKYYIASEIKQRNQLPAQVTILPFGAHFEDVHSLKKVESIVINVCNRASM